MEELIAALSSKDHEKIKEIVNDTSRYFGMSFIEYLAYTKNKKALSEMIPYIEFDENKKFCYGLNLLVNRFNHHGGTSSADAFNYRDILSKTMKSDFLKSQETELFEAIITNKNLDQIGEYQLKHKFLDETPLTIASRIGNVRAVRHLINAGASVSTANSYNKTALDIAAETGNMEIVNIIIRSGRLNNLRTRRFLASKYALINNHIDVYNTLIGKVSTIEEQNHRLNEALTEIIYGTNYDSYDVYKAFDMCFERNINVNEKIINKVFLIAAENGYLKIFNQAIEMGANLLSSSINNETALMLASENGHLDIVNKLFDYNDYEYYLRFDLHDSPLTLAAKNGNFFVVEALLANLRYCHNEIKENECKKALEYAVMSGNMDIIDLLIKENENYADAINSAFYTLVFKVGLKDENFRILRFLVSAGADIHQRNEMGETALFGCKSYEKFERCFRFLIDRGLDVDARDNEGKTVLLREVASHFGRRIINSRIFLECGCDVNAVDNSGYNALLYAVKNEDNRMIDLLINNGAEIDNDSDGARDLLIYGINHNRTAIIDFLNDRGVRIDINNRELVDKMLLDAILNDKLKIIQFLQNNGLANNRINNFLKEVNFDDDYIKQKVFNRLNTAHLSIDINDISNANRDSIIKAINIALTDFGEIANSPFHGVNTPMRDFIDFGTAISCIRLTQEEENDLNDIIAGFDNAIINKDQQKIKNTTNKLLELCKANEDVYSIVDMVIDKNVIYQDSGKSLTRLLNFYGFNTELFCIGMKTNQILTDGIRGVSVLNAKMDDGTEMSIVNKYFKLVYYIVYSNEIDRLAQNKDINNASFLYQQNPTETNKENLINIIIDNSDNEAKDSLLFDLTTFEARINRLGDQYKAAKLEKLFNGIVVSDFGTCLKNRLERELQLNDNQQQEEVEEESLSDSTNDSMSSNSSNGDQEQDLDNSTSDSISIYSENNDSSDDDQEQQDLNNIANANNDLNNAQNQENLNNFVEVNNELETTFSFLNVLDYNE